MVAVRVEDSRCIGTKLTRSGLPSMRREDHTISGPRHQPLLGRISALSMCACPGRHSTYELVEEHDFASFVIDVCLHVAAANPARNDTSAWVRSAGKAFGRERTQDGTVASKGVRRSAPCIAGSEGRTHGKVLRQRGEVSCKESNAADMRSESMQDGVRNRHAVVRRRSTSELVENHERARSRLWYVEQYCVRL